MKQSFSVFKQRFTVEDIARIDPRIRRAMDGWWKVTQNYKGEIVEYPGTWNSEIYPFKYFEVYKQPGDDNPGESENEIQLYMSAGWRGYDDEVLIILTIFGENVLNGNPKVGAEIYKISGAKGKAIKVFRNNRLVTNFTKPFLRFWRRDVAQVLLDDVDKVYRV